MSDFERAMIPDRRRYQLMATVHLVMSAVRKYIPDDGRAQEHATYDLLDALQAAGIDIITAEQRKNAGLPPQNELGWTDHELQILEAKRIEAMLAPIQHLIPSSTPTKSQ